MFLQHQYMHRSGPFHRGAVFIVVPYGPDGLTSPSKKHHGIIKMGPEPAATIDGLGGIPVGNHRVIGSGFTRLFENQALQVGR